MTDANAKRREEWNEGNADRRAWNTGDQMMQEDPIKTARILIVDDQEVNVHFLEGTLRWVAGNTNFKSTTNPREVEALIAEFEPDLILLDLHMPERDGFMVMEDLKQVIPADAFLPILVLTADVTPEAKQRALAGGAKDFLSKPFDTTEVLLRSNNLLQTRLLHLELANQNQILEVKVQERTRDLQKANDDLQAAHRDLEDAHIEMLERMALAAEYRDDDTGEHTKRVGQVSAFLGRAMRLAQDQVMLLRRAAPLHDVGKIAIPDQILLKPGRLTAEEFEVLKTHTTIGGKILSGGRFALLKMAEEIALTHHERWDGTGYPHGLREATIPLAGRIVAVADSFDALTHERPYKEAWAVEEAVAELQRCAGTQFDPTIVDAFLGLRADSLAAAVLGFPAAARRGA